MKEAFAGVGITGEGPFLNVEGVEEDGMLYVKSDELEKFRKALLHAERKKIIALLEGMQKSLSGVSGADLLGDACYNTALFDAINLIHGEREV